MIRRILCGLLISTAAWAWSDDDEQRFRTLAAELRCLVCQNQSIADSNAELAQDLRQQVRTMIEDGQSDREIRAYMTERYGDFVLYRPPFKPTTYLLWAGPLILLVLGAILLVRLRRSNTEQARPDPVDPERLRNILDRADND